MYDLLQWAAAIFYLLNKVFLWLSERAIRARKSVEARKWRILSWVVYLMGLPPWVIIFISERNWIAAALEAAGAPAMVLGLVSAWRGSSENAPRWLDRLALAFVLAGLAYSLYDFGGLTTVNQGLEVGLVFGFLVGTYQLANRQANGYLWFILMHVSCGTLMWIQGYHGLFLQQLASLGFIIAAYRIARQNG